MPANTSQPLANASRTRSNEPPAILTPPEGLRRVLELKSAPHMHARMAKRLAQTPPSQRGLFNRVYAGWATQRQCIRAMCLECLGFDKDGIRNCTAPECPLYRFRPYQK